MGYIVSVTSKHEVIPSSIPKYFVWLGGVVVRTSDDGLVIKRSRVWFPAGALLGSLGKSTTSLLAWVKAGRVHNFTCVGWQVTLCDPI